MSEEKPKVDVNVVQVVASALAAVSSAVLLSTVGVAGTVIGAAVGSVIATVGSAVYSYSLQASRDRVAAAAQLAASARVRRTGPDRTGQQTTREHLQQPPGASTRAPQQATHEAAEEAARPHWREALNDLPWKRVALVTVGVFVAAMVAIVTFELVAGEPVSRITHGTSGDRTGTSIPGLGGGSKSTPTPTPTPTESVSPTESPTETSSTATDAPSESATESPTESPTDSSTASPTPDPGATESPVESSSLSPSAAPTETPAG